MIQVSKRPGYPQCYNQTAQKLVQSMTVSELQNNMQKYYKKKKTQPPPKKHHTTKTKQLQKAHTKKTHTTNLIPLWTGAYNKAKYRINRGGGVGGGGGQI